MIKVSILYPYRENGHFDVDYYCVTHMPLAAKLFGPSLKSWSVDVGINAGPPERRRRMSPRATSCSTARTISTKCSSRLPRN